MGIYANSSFAPAIKINQPIIPSGTLFIDGAGFYNVYSYSSTSVNVEDLLDKMVTTGLTNYLEYSDLSASKINSAAFAGQKISTINMPRVETIGNYAFYNIKYSSSIKFNFSNCTSIGSYAFAFNTTFTNPSSKMEIILNSNISVLPVYCFANNTSLTKINNDNTINCLSINTAAFS